MKHTWINHNVFPREESLKAPRALLSLVQQMEQCVWEFDGCPWTRFIFSTAEHHTFWLQNKSTFCHIYWSLVPHTTIPYRTVYISNNTLCFDSSSHTWESPSTCWVQSLITLWLHWKVCNTWQHIRLVAICFHFERHHRNYHYTFCVSWRRCSLLGSQSVSLIPEKPKRWIQLFPPVVWGTRVLQVGPI